MRGNGLQAFSLHAADKDQRQEVLALKAESDSFGLDTSPEAADAETVARHHLGVALASRSTPQFNMPAAAGLTPEFRLLGTEHLELTGTKTVKFRQAFNKVPVYGSLVTVELDERHNLVTINSALGAPEGVSPLASIAPAAALDTVRAAGTDPDPATPARIIYYYDRFADQPVWRLCYLFQDVPLAGSGSDPDDASEEERFSVGQLPPRTESFVVDAHGGDIVARLPRDADASAPPVQITLEDELGTMRQIRVSPEDNLRSRLHDPVCNVHTYDFGFADAAPEAGLVGSYCVHPPSVRGAVSAHANAVAVTEFLRDVLKRRGVDNKGGQLRSSINCSFRPRVPGAQAWPNAMWSRGQMFYGQRRGANGWLSLAADLDVVAHEIVHGLTQNSADMDYVMESGALNESYSDIFGVIIANYGQPRPAWIYQMGRNFRASGVPLRDLADPAAHGQPAHMRDYQYRIVTDDAGGVHYNSGIHNKAAHLLMTAQDQAGQPLFDDSKLAAIFYIALTQYLSRTSGFSESRRAVELATLSLYRNSAPAILQAHVAAVRSAFDSVGVA